MRIPSDGAEECKGSALGAWRCGTMPQGGSGDCFGCGGSCSVWIKGARQAATRRLSLGGTRDDGMDAQAQCMRRRGKAPKSKRDTSAPLACTQVMLGKAAESASTQE